MAGLRIHAFCDDVLGDYDGVELARLIDRREVHPRELVDAAIARAHEVGGQLRGLASERFETARAEAERAGEGFFSGVPTFLKDNTPLAGMATNHGSAALRAEPARESGVFAKQYLAQGFVCLGKTTLSEFGLNATAEPPEGDPTINPWNTEFSSGASSAGSAAMVAAGVVPIAHANDGGGSIRIPAASCGLVGLKPTRGRHLMSEMARALPVKLVGEGVVTRSVRDTAYFHAQAEYTYRNDRLAPIGQVDGPSSRRFRIGVAVDSVIGATRDPTTRAVIEEGAQLLAGLGHQLERVELPVEPAFADAFLLYWGALAFGIQVAGKRIDASFDRARLDGLTQGLARRFSRRFYRLPFALRCLKRSQAVYARFFERYDALLTPVTGHTTPRLGHLSPAVSFDELLERLRHYVCFTPIANAAGGPAISVPFSQTDEGLPVAIQLFGSHGDERTLIELAYEIEAARPPRRIHEA